jgi:glycosyltransferase involved in cell wall biosynthesis
MELYEWADINVMVSIGEGYGKVFLEGMALGCPAVSGPGLMQESIIGSGLRGRQADAASPTNIADALQELLAQDVDEQAAMISRCAEYAAQFTAEDFAREVAFIIRNIWAISPTSSPTSQ